MLAHMGDMHLQEGLLDAVFEPSLMVLRDLVQIRAQRITSTFSISLKILLIHQQEFLSFIFIEFPNFNINKILKVFLNEIEHFGRKALDRRIFIYYKELRFKT
jgi:hypothetical protein